MFNLVAIRTNGMTVSTEINNSQLAVVRLKGWMKDSWYSPSDSPIVKAFLGTQEGLAEISLIDYSISCPSKVA